MTWLRRGTVALASLIAVYGAVVGVVGVPRHRHEAVPAGTPAGDPELVLSGPTPYGWVFVAAAVLVIVGIFTARLVMAWSGWALIAGFAVLGLFSVGAPVLPVVPVLLLALLALTVWRGRAGARAPARG